MSNGYGGTVVLNPPVKMGMIWKFTATVTPADGWTLMSGSVTLADPPANGSSPLLMDNSPTGSNTYTQFRGDPLELGRWTASAQFVSMQSGSGGTDVT